MLKLMWDLFPFWMQMMMMLMMRKRGRVRVTLNLRLPLIAASEVLEQHKSNAVDSPTGPFNRIKLARDCCFPSLCCYRRAQLPRLCSWPGAGGSVTLRSRCECSSCWLPVHLVV